MLLAAGAGFGALPASGAAATAATGTTAAPATVAPGGVPAPVTRATGTTTFVPSQGATRAPTTSVPTTSVPGTSAPVLRGLGGLQTQPARPLATGPTKKHHAGRGLSTLAIVLAAIGALLLAACAAWAIARERGLEPHWWLSLRHALAEAGVRTSETWAEFSDWARLGH